MKVLYLILTVGLLEVATQEAPMPYSYQYHVQDAPTNNFYGHQETGNAAGRVEGSYQVWLPDGRLMKVTYYVDGDSGFVPKITYENINPLASG